MIKLWVLAAVLIWVSVPARAQAYCGVPSSSCTAVADVVYRIGCDNASGTRSFRAPGAGHFVVARGPLAGNVGLRHQLSTVVQFTTGAAGIVYACQATSSGFLVFVAEGVTDEFFMSRVANVLRALAVATPSATLSPVCPAPGPGATLVAWTQADVDAVRASSAATTVAAQATLAAVQAQTLQAATTQAVLAAPAEQGRDWSVVGTLLASVLAGFVTAYRVV